MDNTTINPEILEQRKTSLVKPEHELNYIKEQILAQLTEQFFVSKNDPAREQAMNFMESISQARDGIANALTHDQIVKNLETIKEPAQKFKDATEPDSTLGLISRKISSNIKSNNPSTFVSQLSQSFQDKYKSGFFDEQKATPSNLSKVGAFFKAIDNELRDSMGMSRLPDRASPVSKFTFTKQTPETLLQSTGTLYDKNKEEYHRYDNEVIQPMLQKFAFSCLLPDSPHIDRTTQWVQNFTNRANEVANNMGMTPETLGHNGKIGLFRSNQIGNGGAFSTEYNIFIFPNDVSADVIVHEWTHAVDFNSAKKVVKEEYQEAQGLSDIEFSNLYLENTKVHNSVHSSNRELDIIIKDTPKIKGLMAVRDIMATALAGNIDDVRKHQNKERNNINQGFWRETLGDSYHSLTKEARKTLDSDSSFTHIRNSIKRPNETEHKEAIIQTLQNAGIDNPQIFEKVRNPDPNSIFHKNAPNMVIKMEDVNIGKKTLFKFQAGILDGIKNASMALSGAQGNGNVNNKDYYRSNIEMLARYVQSNAFPKKPSDFNELFWRKHGVDKSWNEQRRNLIVANFGENALSDSPMNKIDAKNERKNEGFLKASMSLIKTIASEKFEQLKETFQELKNINLSGKITDVKFEPADNTPHSVGPEKPKLAINTPAKENERHIQQEKHISPTKPKM